MARRFHASRVTMGKFPGNRGRRHYHCSDANNRVWAITNAGCSGQPPVLHTPADLQANNNVDFFDLTVMAQSWRNCTDPLNPTLCAAGISAYGLYAPGDVDRDAYVNIWDLNAFVEEWLTQSQFE